MPFSDVVDTTGASALFSTDLEDDFGAGSCCSSPPSSEHGLYVPEAARRDGSGNNGYGSYEARNGARPVMANYNDDQSNGVRSRSHSGGQQAKPQQEGKRSRGKKQKFVQEVKAEQIDGFQGNKDIDELLKFIDPKAAKKDKQTVSFYLPY